MNFFCSKDCPDLCEFNLEIENGHPVFTPISRPFDNIPFVCTKLKDFYKMENNNHSPFYVIDNEKKFVNNEDVIRKCAYYLKSVKDENILYLRGSGSLGYMMGYWDVFMSQFANTYFIDGNPCDETGICANEEDFGCAVNPDYKNLEETDCIFLFGKNARDVSPHFYSYLKNLKHKGKKIVYIDPVKTSTSKIADYYFRINPGTDGILTAALLSKITGNHYYDVATALNETGISEEEFEIIISNIKPGKTGFIVGFGLQRYTNGKNSVQWINRLAVYTNNIDNLYYGRSSKSKFIKPKFKVNNKISIANVVNKINDGFFKTVFIVASNPAVTYPDTNNWLNGLKNTTVITIDVKHSETVKLSDFFIKVGGMFAQADVMGSYFFNIEAERDRFKNELSDTDIILKLANELNFDIKIPDAISVKPVKKEPVRNFKDKVIEVKKPMNIKNKYRLITSSHILYLNSQSPDKYKDIDNYVFISPDDAKKKDIADNEKIELIGENGNLYINAKISDKVAKGVLLIYKNRASYGQVSNVLTNNIATDSDNGLAYYDTFVELKKIEE